MARSIQNQGKGGRQSPSNFPPPRPTRILTRSTDSRRPSPRPPPVRSTRQNARSSRLPLASVRPCVAAFRCGFHPCALFHPPLHSPRRKSRPKQKNSAHAGAAIRPEGAICATSILAESQRMAIPMLVANRRRQFPRESLTSPPFLAKVSIVKVELRTAGESYLDDAQRAIQSKGDSREAQGPLTASRPFFMPKE
jgi:hypothetical protein